MALVNEGLSCQLFVDLKECLLAPRPFWEEHSPGVGAQWPSRGEPSLSTGESPRSPVLHGLSRSWRSGCGRSAGALAAAKPEVGSGETTEELRPHVLSREAVGAGGPPGPVRAHRRCAGFALPVQTAQRVQAGASRQSFCVNRPSSTLGVGGLQSTRTYALTRARTHTHRGTFTHARAHTHVEGWNRNPQRWKCSNSSFRSPQHTAGVTF